MICFSVSKKGREMESKKASAETKPPLKVLLFVESFHPFTSGVARRFKKRSQID